MATHADVYYRHYANQLGGSMPVFKGTPYQSGEGLGDFFRSVARFIIPIFAPAAASAASKFVSSTAESLEQGKSFGEAAKSALPGTLSAGIETTKERLMRRMAQHGSGRRRRRRRHSTKTRGTTRKANRSVYKRRRKNVKHRKTKRRVNRRSLPFNF